MNMEVSVQKCCEILRGMDDIVILSHRNPDGDTLGSAFALHYILNQLGKRSRIECHDGFPKQYSYLLAGYEEKDFEPKNIVAVDIADEQLFGEKLEKYRGKVDLCIDHHGSNKHYAKDWLVRDTAAACCEIIEDICYGFEEAELTKLIADCIYTGVSTDTGCFRYSNTTGHTHAVAGRMFKAGCDFVMINRAMFEVKSFSRIAIEREVLNSLELYFDNKCAVVCITKKMLEETGAEESELEGVAAPAKRSMLPVFAEISAAAVTAARRDASLKAILKPRKKRCSKLLKRFWGRRRNDRNPSGKKAPEVHFLRRYRKTPGRH